MVSPFARRRVREARAADADSALCVDYRTVFIRPNTQSQNGYERDVPNAEQSKEEHP